MIKSAFVRHSLMQRLLIGFLMTAILPLTGFALFNLYNFEKVLSNTILDNMAFVADKKAFKINHYIEDSRSQIQALSHTPEMFVLFDELKRTYYAGGIHSTAYLQADNKARAILSKIIDRYDYYDLFLIDETGEIVFSLKQESDFATNLQTGVFKDSGLANGFRESLDFLTTEFSTFSDYQPTDSKLAAFTTSPLLEKGLPVGVLAVQTNLEGYLPIILDREGLGESGETVLAKQSESGKSVFVTPLRYSKSNRSDIEIATAMKLALNGSRGQGLAVDYAGNNVVSAWQYLPDLHFGMVVKINKDEAFASFAQLRFYTFLMLGCLIIFVITIAVIIGRSIVIPVRNLIEVTTKISKGDLNQRVPISYSNNEFIELAQTFNYMAEQIKQSYDHLERRVETRTFELNTLNKEMRAVLKFQNALLDYSSYPIIAATPEGIITVFNKAAEAMLGYTADEIIGKQTPAIFHDLDEVIARSKEFSDELNIPVEVGFETFVIKSHLGLENEHEWTYISKNGQRTDVLLSINALQDVAGMYITGYLGIAVNITARKAAEAKLVEAKQIAENANHAKSEFLANMSHEIRTPMNAILGLTQLVLETELTHRQRDFLNKVYLSSRALLNVLNDILDYSKIEAGHLDIESVPCHLETILMNVADLFSAKLSEKGLELFFEIDPTTPYTILSDPLRINQILNNLVSNAIKFTAAGEIQIKVKSLRTQGNTQTLQFSVRDTGVGLSAQQIESLFQPFTQADTSISRKYGGTGLGLAICYRLVNLMNGKISISSVQGEGSTFSFTIDALLPQEVENSLVELQKFKGQRVLVVDDQVTSVTILKTLLEAWGIEVETALSGREALEKINAAKKKQACFDSVLLDWHMPDIDGLEVARQLRGHSCYGDALVIIMVTAYDKQELFIKSAELNISSVLTKPIIPSTVFNALLDNPVNLQHSRHVEDGEKVLSEMRVLLVEDHKINQQVATEFLTSRGAIVTIANHGIEAISHFEKATFDVILMDLHMPEMDGLEATKRIRTLPNGDSVPIIAMTAAVMNEDRERCLQAGMVDFIAKPVQVEQLIQALCHWVKKEDFNIEVNPQISHTDNSALNIVAALNRLNGNAVLLSRLLNDFAIEHKHTIDRLNELLSQKEFETATKLLHSIKGVSANLSAIPLSQSASQLERQIKEEIELTALPAFVHAMQQTLAAIEQCEIHSKSLVVPVDENNILSNEELLRLLENLRPCLQNNDFIPESLLEPLRNTHSQGEIKTRLSQLWTQLDGFDYNSALNTLEQLTTFISDSSL